MVRLRLVRLFPPPVRHDNAPRVQPVRHGVRRHAPFLLVDSLLVLFRSLQRCYPELVLCFWAPRLDGLRPVFVSRLRNGPARLPRSRSPRRQGRLVYECYRWRPVRVGGPLVAGIGLFGVLCTFLPLVVPTYAFWMTWGTLGPIPELIAYRIGSPSILRDLEQGRPDKLLALIIGGSWAGLAWEGLNAAARCKWIYTVPGLEELKLFEIPVLGFVGFPALALNAYPTMGWSAAPWGTGRGHRPSPSRSGRGVGSALSDSVWSFRSSGSI